MKVPSHGSRKYGATEIADCVVRYQASGKGLRQFAEQAGLPAHRLHYWVYQKKGPDRAHGRPEPVFQEMALPGILHGGHWAAEIQTPNGLLVRVGSDADPTWIGAIVAKVHRPC